MVTAPESSAPTEFIVFKLVSTDDWDWSDCQMKKSAQMSWFGIQRELSVAKSTTRWKREVEGECR